VGDHQVAPGELGERLVAPGAADATVVAEAQVNQLGADLAGSQVLDQPHDVDLPLCGDDLGVQRVGLDAEGLE